MSEPRKIRRALISVYDKTGIVDFARALAGEFGVEIISTGGTAALLKERGIPVTLVEEVTGFPEMMDGRVKTLHPKIHAGILADRDNPEHMRQLAEQGIEPIDMVVVNLYPFEKTVADPNCTFEQAIEMIDIGGPCLLRAAAKNHRHVLPVSDPCHYERTLKYLRGDAESCGPEWPTWLLTKAFQHTAGYDIVVHNHFARRHWETVFPPVMFLDLGGGLPTTGNEFRYGENPHQRGTMYFLAQADDRCSVVGASFDANSESLSYNNVNDAEAALSLIRELCRPGDARRACNFIKHTNACGVGIAESPVDAYRRAYLGDPNAAMGGILACNFDVDAQFAHVVMDTYAQWGKEAGAGGFFVEVWIATAFNEAALEVIKTSKQWGERVRLLAVAGMNNPTDQPALEYRSIAGGMLVQTQDNLGLNEDQWKVVTKRPPTDAEMADLRLAWLVCKHTKSNAITICKDGMLIGNGAGQMSRVMSCRIAVWLARENGHLTEEHCSQSSGTQGSGTRENGPVAASDAFFPFSDGPTILMDAGVTALIQPGGSKRDEDTIKACDERGVAMIFTGTRHFRH